MRQRATGPPAAPLWRAADLAAALNISIRQLWRMRAAGELPAPVRVGRRCVRWRAEDVARYLDQLRIAR
jgi:predicted DNA-binding transcriptional regulator AlpA